MFRARRELVAGPLVSSVATPCLPRGSNTCADRSHDHRGCRGGANPRWAAVDVDRGDAGQLQSGPRTRWCPGFSGYVRMRRAESLDVSSFAAQDACAAEQPPPAKRSPCRAGLPEAAPAYRSSRRDGGGGPWGVHAWTVNGVRREAEVEPRVLIDYFLWESLGAHQHRPRPSRARRGPCAVRPLLEEGEPWRKDRSQARPRLRSTPSAR
jgi:hypothetical protein